MLNKRVTSWLPMAAILALIAVAFLTAPVFAQDEAPVEPAPEEVPLEEAVPAEEAPAELPEGVALAVENESGEAVSLASEEAVQILAEADPWFKVGTVDYNFTTGDCDPTATVTPCANPIQAAIDWVRDHATIPTDGLIHIDNGTYSGMPIDLDGSNVNVNKLKGLQGSLDAASNLPNVLLNDRIYVTNKTTPFTLSNLSVIGSFPNVALVEFTNNSGAMILQDMVITNTGGTASTGLRMEQTGAITLNRVNVSNNMVDGAVLDNDAGTAGITITNSSFEWNGGTGTGTGLTIYSKGVVLLNNLSIVQNHQKGVSATTTKSLTVKNSIINQNGNAANSALVVEAGSSGLVWIENSAFSSNRKDGINITLAGDVTLKNLMLEYNQRSGVYINTCVPGGIPGTACTALGNGNVTVTGSYFYSNHSSTSYPVDGDASLYVWAKGAITLSDVTVIYSGYYNSPVDKALTYGAYLYNGDAPSAKNVSITKSVFSSNTATGLYIRTWGSVSMNDISATNNSIFTAADPNHHGVYIDASLGAGTVTLSDTLGSSSFNYNDGDGIHILAKGTVSLTNLEAYSNGYYAETVPYNNGMGVYINNLTGTGSVTLKKIYAEYNRNSGVEVLTNGSVTLDTAELQNNGDSYAGTALKIGDPANPAGAVTLKRLGIQFNSIDGLTVYTKSNVLMDYIDVYQQQSGGGTPYGAFIDATYGTGTVTLQNTLGVSSGNNNRFSNNPLFGLRILARGKVSLTDANISNNAGGNGLFINNSTGTGDVVLSKIYAEYNRVDGIQILSAGNVTLSNGYGDSNGNGGTIGFGVRIDNTPASTPKTVTITNFRGSYNEDLGFWVVSDGAINLKSIAAYSNGNASATPDAAGALFNNTSGTTAGVTMTRVDNNNSFSDHFTSGSMPGLRILSNGAVSLSYVDASGNDLAGVIIKNDYPSKTGGVTLSNMHVWLNDEQNLVLHTNGAVKLTTGSFSNVSGASPNVEIQSLPATGAPTISLSKVDIWDSTNATGLRIYAKGSITLNAVTSNGNAGVGMELYNETGTGGVSILGTLGVNEVDSNSLEGLIIHTRGAIVLSRLDVYNNGHPTLPYSGPAIHGAILDNTDGVADVTLTNVNFTVNVYGSGVQISTLGKVTWTGGEVEANGYNLTAGSPAVTIDNQPAILDPLAPAKTVTITNVLIHENNGNGLVVRATGAITLSGVKIYSQIYTHSDYGAWLDNSDYSGGVTVTGSGNQFNGQSNFYGLYIDTRGKVSLSNLEASGNDRQGIDIDNKAGKQDVVITNATINANLSGNGLTILSLGNITLTSVTANSNGSNTAYYNAMLVNNDDPLVTRNVTIYKSNFDNGNGNGLYVYTNGNILVNKISSSNHGAAGADGVVLNNSAGTGYVSMLNTYGANTISNNNEYNLYVSTNGAVIVNGLVAMNSTSSSGAIIRNHLAPTGNPGVTVSNSTFSQNSNGEGLSVSSKGAITITNITAQSNGYSNAKLDNQYDLTHTKAITVTRSNFSYGVSIGGEGLSITASAAVVLNTVTASGTQTNGVFINALSFSTGAVTISGTNIFSDNQHVGLRINAVGAITAGNITANGNSYEGLNLDTDGAITITNTMLKNNGQTGIMADAGGNIVLTGVTTMLNGRSGGFDGMHLNASGHNITITNGISFGNGGNGIEALTGTGIVTIKNSLFAGNGYPSSLSIADLVYSGILKLE